MGVALAAAAWRRGAHVTLIAGPLAVTVPQGIRHVPVETTGEMAAAVEDSLRDADVLIMAAAPADFRAAQPAPRKIKKANAPSAIALAEAPDILLSTRAARRNGLIVVGFALETDDAVAGGREKLSSKGLDLIVVNDATEQGAGFGVDTNRVTIVDRGGGEEELPLLPKADVADAILDRVEALSGGS